MFSQDPRSKIKDLRSKIAYRKFSKITGLTADHRPLTTVRPCQLYLRSVQLGIGVEEIEEKDEIEEIEEVEEVEELPTGGWKPAFQRAKLAFIPYDLLHFLKLNCRSRSNVSDAGEPRRLSILDRGESDEIRRRLLRFEPDS